jgi:hypothetical protein
VHPLLLSISIADFITLAVFCCSFTFLLALEKLAQQGFNFPVE